MRLRVPPVLFAAGFRAEVRLAPDDLLAELPDRFVVERLAAGLRALEERLAPAVEDLARALVERLAVERFAVDRLAEVFRLPLDERAPDDLPPVAAPPPPDSSDAHLPDITRFAASATASAINEPNLVALAIMLVAACDAVSAASRPASRILRRADGLALIAAAAAARPAASISLLIAAFANLSTVPDELDEDRREVFFADFAMDFSPCVAMKAL